MKLSWNGSGQKIYGNIVMRWQYWRPDFSYYEVWSKSGDNWTLLLDLTIWDNGQMNPKRLP